MFAVCLCLFNQHGKTVWPIYRSWNAQKPHESYGQCRTTVILQKNSFSKFFEWFWELPWNLTNLRKMKVILEESFEPGILMTLSP